MLHSGVMVHSGVIPVDSGTFRSIPVHSGPFRSHSVSFRSIPVSFRFIPVHSVVIPLHSGLFRSIPPHSGSFRSVSVFSNALMASGIARGPVGTTTTVAILQIIGWQRHAALVYHVLF